MNVNEKLSNELQEELKISLAKKIETLKPEKRAAAVKAELTARAALAALALHLGAEELSVTIDGQEYEFINKGIQKRKAQDDAKKARQAADKAEFEAAKEAEPVRDYAAEIEAIKADTSLTNTEKAAVLIAKINAEKVTDRFETEPDANTPWFELYESDSFSRPARQYLRPGTKAEVAKLKKVMHVEDYRQQMRALLGEIS